MINEAPYSPVTKWIFIVHIREDLEKLQILAFNPFF